MTRPATDSMDQLAVLESRLGRGVESSRSISAPRVLVLLRQIADAKELWPLALGLRDGGYACTVVAGREALAWPQASGRLFRRYQEAGFPVLGLDGRPWQVGVQAAPAASPAARGPLAWGRWIMSTKRFTFGLRAIAEFIACVRRNRTDDRNVQQLLSLTRPSAIVMQEYGHLCPEAIVTYRARQQGIATVMVAGADNGQIPEASLQTFLVNHRAALVNARRPSNSVVAWLFPRWVRTYRGMSMLRYPAAESLAAWCTGLLSSDPWLPNRWAEHRATLCERSRDDIVRTQGAPAGRFEVTGQPALDPIFEMWKSAEERRANMLDRLGVAVPCRRLVVFPVPQLVPHRILTPAQQMAFVDTVLRSISTVPDARMVLSLYIGGDAENYRPLAERYGAVISDLDVRELVAVGDLLISVRSSIIWTAIACQKPTIAVDFWNTGPVNFYECPGVQLVERPEALALAVSRLLADNAAYEAAAQALRRAAPHWASTFDGQATARVVRLIDEVVGSWRRTGF